MKLESVGIRVLFVALVLVLLAGLALFPVWSVGPGGSGMRILLGYIYDANPTLGFVLDRVGPAAAVLGILGVGLLEASRGRVARDGGAWNRERITLLVAIVGEGATLGSVIFIESFGMNLLRIWAAIAIVMTVAVGLYLFWTARPRVGAWARPILWTAFGTGCLSAVLAFQVAVLEFPPSNWDAVSGLDVSRWLLGELSLGLWIVAYAGVLWTKPTPASPAAAASPHSG